MRKVRPDARPNGWYFVRFENWEGDYDDWLKGRYFVRVENWDGGHDDWCPALRNGTYWRSHKYTGECRRVETRPKIRTMKGIKTMTTENLKKFASATGGELFDPDFQWMVEAIETQETLEQWWEESLLHWREQSRTKTGKIAGFRFLAWENAQVSRGQLRQSMSVVDLGDVRIVLPGTDLMDFKEKKLTEVLNMQLKEVEK